MSMGVLSDDSTCEVEIAVGEFYNSPETLTESDQKQTVFDDRETASWPS